MAVTARYPAQIIALVPESTKATIAERAEARGVSESEVIRELLADGLDANAIRHDLRAP